MKSTTLSDRGNFWALSLTGQYEVARAIFYNSMTCVTSCVSTQCIKGKLQVYKRARGAVRRKVTARKMILPVKKRECGATESSFAESHTKRKKKVAGKGGGDIQFDDRRQSKANHVRVLYHLASPAE